MQCLKHRYTHKHTHTCLPSTASVASKEATVRSLVLTSSSAALGTVKEKAVVHTRTRGEASSCSVPQLSVWVVSVHVGWVVVAVQGEP